jgi:hypothetical protein
MAAALDGNLKIVFPCKQDRCNHVGGRCASHDDAGASIKATVPNLA